MAKWSALEVPAGEVPVPDAEAAPGVPARGYGPDSSRRGYGPEDFPGCESFHLPESALEGYEGRLEFWDGHTETAWKVSEPTSPYHEGPSRRLVEIATRVAMLRGSRIVSFGASDLVRRDASGRLRWLMQADEVLYLHVEQARLGRDIDVDAYPLPDVVLEVDHSTDVRRCKLGIYQDSGFPEIWVLVPWKWSRRAPGLAIHVRGDEGYREARESRAFPGWKAEEIHHALTEDPWTAETISALERVARAMGSREGTRPEDDPFTRSISRRAEARGDARGYARARREERAASVRAVFAGAGHRGGAGLGGRPGAHRVAPVGGPDGGGARVHRRSRLPATGPRAARPAPRALALRRRVPGARTNRVPV